MKFLDAVSLNGTTLREDGFLVADAFTARTGIQYYSGAEIRRPELPVVAVYRDESDVFAHPSLSSFSHVPITIGHPDQKVDASNWRDLAVGETSTEVLREGNRLRIPLIIKAADAISIVKAGTRQLSVGYDCDLVWESGVHDGVEYHARQTNIRANHIAIVDQARGGPELRIGDWVNPVEVDDMSTAPMFKSVTIDGITIQTTEQGEQAIAKLQKQLTDSTADLTALRATVGEKDKEIGTLKIDLQKLKDAPPPDIDKLVAERSKLVDAALAIAKDLKTEGLKDTEIRKAAVVAAFGEDMVKDASDAQIEGMFAAASVTKRDPVADAMRHRKPESAASPTPGGDNGQLAYETRLRDAWKGKAA